MMRLHLGCGERHLQGYINIDLPRTEHPVQQKDCTDVHGNIMTLSYPAGSIEEVRLHHVFEHFPRPIACAFLASWNSWLCMDGVLHIEVPDLDTLVTALANPDPTMKGISVAERHIFGSHEASWAVHYEGYTEKMLSLFLEEFGFKVTTINKNCWKGTQNIEILAKKVASLSRDACRANAERYLQNYLLDDSVSEKILLSVWMQHFDDQIAVSFSHTSS